MREVKANYKGNNLQHRVVKKLSKAARDCGITSLGSYRLEYKERQKQYNARRDAASAVQVIKLWTQLLFMHTCLEHVPQSMWRLSPVVVLKNRLD